MPQPSETIVPDNASQIRELTRWGKGIPNQAVLSPDGRYLAVASSLGIYMYDAQTLAELRLIETGIEVSAVSFSHDGQYLAVGFVDGQVGILNVSDGTLRQSLQANTYEPIKKVIFSLDGQILAALTEYGDQLTRWQLSGNAYTRNLNGYRGDVILSPKGDIYAVAGGTGKVDLRSLVDDHVVGAFQVDTEIFGLEWRGVEGAFSADGQTFALADPYGERIFTWQVSDQSLLSTVEIDPYYGRGGGFARTCEIDGPDGGAGQVAEVNLSPDGSLLAIGLNYRGITQVHRTADGAALYILPQTRSSVGFSADGSAIVSIGSDKSVDLWNTYDGSLENSITGFTTEFTDVAISPDGELIAARDNGLDIRRTVDGARLFTLRGTIGEAVFSPDNLFLATGTNGNAVGIFGLRDGSLSRKLEGHISAVTSVAFSPTGDLLASSSLDCTIDIWRLADGQLLTTIKTPTSMYNEVQFSLNGDYLLINLDFGPPQIWQVREQAFLPAFETIDSDDMVFSPDGAMLASSESEGLVFRRLSDASVLHSIEMPGGGPGSVAFSADGKLIAGTLGNGVIGIWQVSDGALLAELRGHNDYISDLAFSSDGTWLVSSSRDGTVRLWGVLP